MVSDYYYGKDEIDMKKVEEEYNDSIEKLKTLTKKSTDDLLERIKYFKTHSFEEVIKNSGYNQKNEFNSGAFEEIKREHILYNLMTEEQIKKYLELFYASTLNSVLSTSRERSILENRQTANIHKRVPNVITIKNIESLNLDEINRKDKIKRKLGKTFKEIGLDTAYGISASTFMMVLAEVISGFSISTPHFFAGLGILTAFHTACALASIGKANLEQFFKDKEAIEKAKELGMYDLLVEEYKSRKEFSKFTEDLEQQHFGEEAKGKVL